MAKHVWYEESVGIPLILAGPGLTPGICGSVIGSADILPTLLDWMGLPIPKTVEGASFFPQIQQHVKEDESLSFLCACPGRDVFLKEFAESRKDPKDFGWRAVRTGRWMYVADVGYSPQPQLRRYLYDLKNDPLQLNPKCLEDPDQDVTAERLEQALVKFLCQQKDGFAAHLCLAGEGDGNQ